MIDKELFYKIANENFRVFETVNESSIRKLFCIYPDKNKMREFISGKILFNIDKIYLPEKTLIEIYVILTEFLYKNNISIIESCAVYRIISDVMECFKENKTKREIYEQFKKSTLTFAMDRFYYQIGILKKETIYLITNFFVDVIYRRYYLILYCMTVKENIDIDITGKYKYDLNDVSDLFNATEILEKNVKVLRMYIEGKRHKTENEQKIEMVIECEREKFNKKMIGVFKEQNDAFNRKVDDMLKNKKQSKKF